MKKHAELADVPMLLDAVTQRYRPQGAGDPVRAAGHGTAVRDAAGRAAARVETLRAAFAAATRDPEFLQEADKLKFEIDLMDGKEMQALMGDLYAMPKDVVERDQAGPAGSDEAVTPRRRPSW